MKAINNSKALITISGKPVKGSIVEDLSIKPIKKKNGGPTKKALKREYDFSFPIENTPEVRRLFNGWRNDAEIERAERRKAYLKTKHITID